MGKLRVYLQGADQVSSVLAVRLQAAEHLFVNSQSTAKVLASLRSDSESDFDVVGSLQPDSESPGQGAEHLDPGTRCSSMDLPSTLKPDSQSTPKVPSRLEPDSQSAHDLIATLKPYAQSALKVVATFVTARAVRPRANNQRFHQLRVRWNAAQQHASQRARPTRPHFDKPHTPVRSGTAHRWEKFR